MTSLLIALAAIQLSAGPSVHKIELLPQPAGSPVQVSLPRDQRLDLEITVIAPDEGAKVEDLEIVAENLQAGYWTHRNPANLFVTVERVNDDGSGEVARARVITSGAGVSLREHYRDVQIDFLDSAENRRNRIREFFQKASPQTPPPASLEGAVRYFEVGYVANPPGRYRIELAYKPATGELAGKTLRRTLLVRVDDGPDTLDRLAK